MRHLPLNLHFLVLDTFLLNAYNKTNVLKHKNYTGEGVMERRQYLCIDQKSYV